MPSFSDEITRAALEHAAASHHHPACKGKVQMPGAKPCDCHVGKAHFALSVLDSHGYATCDELREELGQNWVLARRSPRIVREYGEDVLCYSKQAYAKGERAALAKRAARLGVVWS